VQQGGVESDMAVGRAAAEEVYGPSRGASILRHLPRRRLHGLDRNVHAPALCQVLGPDTMSGSVLVFSISLRSHARARSN
jgi:hypothetical protein